VKFTLAFAALFLCSLFKLKGVLPDVVMVTSASYILYRAARFVLRKVQIRALKRRLIEVHGLEGAKETGAWKDLQ
jgi:hypothetical protein